MDFYAVWRARRNALECSKHRKTLAVTARESRTLLETRAAGPREARTLLESRGVAAARLQILCLKRGRF
jgi:hypothetical protein